MLNPNLKPPPTQGTDLLLAAEQEETRTERTNFSDAVKAQVFARDRGMCAFTGLSLWLLDEGACGFYNVPWIDHVIPATRGGTSTEDNGVVTHWAYNYNKSNTMGGNSYLFLGGMPTYRYWEYHRRLTPDIARAIANNAQMHPADYYFNQALACLIWGVVWLHAGKKAGYKRDDAYYAKAALKQLTSWRKMVKAKKVSSLEERGLVPELLLDDQELLLSLRDKETEEEIRQLMQKVLPYHGANQELKLAFENAYFLWLEGDDSALDGVSEQMANPLVSAVVAEDLVWNIRLLVDPFRDWEAEDKFALQKE